jgi:hypothetical protein
MQGGVFVTIQGTRLNAVFVGDCAILSQMVWPGKALPDLSYRIRSNKLKVIWIVAYILLVFGLEVAWRGFQRKRFAPRGQWNTPICWIIVALLLVLTWIPSHLRPFNRPHCLASLIWWAAPWSDFGVVITSALIGLYIVTASAIARQLFRTAKVDREERISASRTVYYLVVGTIMMVRIIHSSGLIMLTLWRFLCCHFSHSWFDGTMRYLHQKSQK